MAKISIKTDFKDGDKLFAVQLNNNFKTIQEAWDAVNGIVWQGDDNEDVIMYKGTTEEIENKSVINGQVIWNTDTGEMYLDANDQRINTGSGNTVTISEIQPAADGAHKIWVKPSKMVSLAATYVVDSMSGNETDKSPSVHAIKDYVDTKSLDLYLTAEVKTNKIWIDGKPIYRKVIRGTKNSGWTDVDISSIDFDSIYIDNSATHFIFTAGGSTYNKPDYYLSSNDYITAQIEPSQKRISIGAGSQLSNIKYNIVIEYTKTTD